MIELAQTAAGLITGYAIASYIESYLHEHVSDAPQASVRSWRRFPRLLRPLINTNSSHHVIHHHRTFRANHVTQFRNQAEQAKLHEALLARGRHGRIIIGGDYANKLHAEGAFVFCLPAILIGAAASLFLPWSFLLGLVPMLCLPPLLSYFVHPYLHMSFEDGQARAPRALAALLRTGYMRAVYRNHFIHHEHGGTSNYNLLLGADVLRRRTIPPSETDYLEMKKIGIPVD